ncbi:MAG: FAD/NAD(P)-binding protein [Opitutaceae bacterium]|nr:FAD/NAD(P)-binding protein [Cytophagales bacterium]
MLTENHKKRIAIIGAGPSGLYIFDKFIKSGNMDFELDIFEKKKQFGSGMPYSAEGANEEHVTNVSDNEIPHLETTINEWIKTVPKAILTKFKINLDSFNEYKVLPRLLFGQYLSSQFELLKTKAKRVPISVRQHIDVVEDIQYQPNEVTIKTISGNIYNFDFIVICTGHHWPTKEEGKIPGYFDSPYPPAKLRLLQNNAIAIRGTSLTAIDAIRTLARHNGSFSTDKNGKLKFNVSNNSPDFKIVMHSRNGMLPAVRFHLEDSHLSSESLLSKEEIAENILQNDGFLSLDFLFEKDFKEKFIRADPKFYTRIKDQSIEDFVDSMMELREKLDPFQLLKEEYAEAEKSIKRKESIHWKEMLAVLSFGMNQPAKHLSAEDMLRLQKILMPLIAIVIAFVPQSSCRELIALYEAGILNIVPVGSESAVVPVITGGINYNYRDEDNDLHSVYYKTFVDCIGQPHLSFEEFPFKSLMESNTISPAYLRFKSAEKGYELLAKGNKSVLKSNNGNYYLKVPGIAINDNFQVVDEYGSANNRIYIMSVPYIGGYNPDYSGLDFCNSASDIITKSMLSETSWNEYQSSSLK